MTNWGACVVAERLLFAHVQEQPRAGRAAERGLEQPVRRGVIASEPRAAGTEAERQLALRDLLLLDDFARGGSRRSEDFGVRLIDCAGTRGGKRRFAPHGLDFVRGVGSAVKKLDFRGGKRLAPRRKQLFGDNFARVFYRAESRRAVALAVAHEGGQAAHRPRARVVP